MGRADFLRLGDYNVVCYFCGRKRKASEMKRYWKGFFVCPEEWEPRQPQDFVRGVPDIQTPAWTQPPPRDVFIAFCSIPGATALAGIAVAGCMTAGRVPPPGYDPFYPPN